MDKNNGQDDATTVFSFNIRHVEEHHLKLLEEYNTCYLCGSSLDFAHVTNFVTGVVTEDSECGTCGIKKKKKHHSLQ